MKAKLVFTTALMALFLKVSAQEKPERDFKNEFLVSSGTYFSTKVTDKKWNNINGKSYTSAKYADYTGQTFVKLFPAVDAKVSLEYAVKTEKGELQIEVADSNDNVIFTENFTQSEKGKVELSLKGGENYQIRFNGKNTKGSYLCQWIAHKN